MIGWKLSSLKVENFVGARRQDEKRDNLVSDGTHGRSVTLGRQKRQRRAKEKPKYVRTSLGKSREIRRKILATTSSGADCLISIPKRNTILCNKITVRIYRIFTCMQTEHCGIARLFLAGRKRTAIYGLVRFTRCTFNGRPKNQVVTLLEMDL